MKPVVRLKTDSGTVVDLECAVIEVRLDVLGFGRVDVCVKQLGDMVVGFGDILDPRDNWPLRPSALEQIARTGVLPDEDTTDHEFYARKAKRSP